MHHAHPPFELGLGLPAVAESAPGNLGTDDLFAQGARKRSAAHAYFDDFVFFRNAGKFYDFF